MWFDGFATALQSHNILFLLLGTVIGLVVGILPAVGPSFGVALALPFTFAMEPGPALILLCSIQAACAYGDSIASILVNVPGGPGTVASCWDGYPMAKQGKAGTALGIAATASLMGGVISWTSLALLAAPITMFALKIGPPEYFALGVMALGLVSLASKGETIRGVMMCCMGLLLSFIGEDPITATTFRFSFGIPALEPGIEEVIAALAIFAVPALAEMIAMGGSISDSEHSEINDSVFNGVKECFKRPMTFLRASLVGWFVGILPALGSSVAGISAYLVEKKYSKESDMFGKGAPGGLMAAEVGKGSCIVGDCIPAFTLGVPGSVTTAILMAALIIHGVQPGPRFMTSGVLPYVVFAGLLLGQFAYFIFGMTCIRYMAKLVFIPNAILGPVLAVVVFLGAFVTKNYAPDIFIMLILAVFSFWADKRKFATVSFVLGFLLGPLIETNFHRSLGVGYGSYAVFFTRPICLGLLIITALFMLWPYIITGVNILRQKKAAEEEPALKADSYDLIFLIFSFAFIVVFLVIGWQYSPAVRLLPTIVGWLGLALCAYQIITAFSQHNLKPIKFTKPEFKMMEGKIPPWLTFIILFVMAGLIPVLGFIVVSIITMLALSLLMGYKNWKAMGGALVFLGVLMFTFVRFLDVILPKGPWGF